MGGKKGEEIKKRGRKRKERGGIEGGKGNEREIEGGGKEEDR